MTPQAQVELLRRCIALMEAGQPPATEEETLIPVEHYVDPARFEREREVLHAHHLNVVGHGCELPEPGDFITRQVVGQPVIVVRGDDGRLRAFLNVCRHRGAQVELRDHGHCKRFVCPYHAWTYDRAGQLASVRHQSGFPSLKLADEGLVPLACHELAGLIWVCPDPELATLEPSEDDRTLAAELEGLLGELLTPAGASVFATGGRVYAANFKLIVDGGLESYHFRVAHKRTVAPFFADNVHVYDSIGPHTRTTLPRVTLPELAGRPEEEWQVRKQAHLVYSLAPNASVLVQEGHFELIITSALNVAESLVRILTIVPAPGPEGHSDKAATFWSANHSFTMATLEEDFVLAEQIQRGLATGANRHFRFATFEGALTAWHRRLEAQLAEAEAAV